MGDFLTSGGSEALLRTPLCARRVKFSEEVDGKDGRPHFGQATVYITELTHHAVIKGAVLAGITKANVRVVQSKPYLSAATDAVDLLKASPLEMDPEALEEAILQDKASGKIPFMVVATCETTSVGSVDNMEGVSAIAQSHGLWMHVDGAYGAFLAGLTSRGKEACKGMALADSVSLDFHKALFQPRAVAALVVRDRSLLLRAFSLTDRGSAAYMPASALCNGDGETDCGEGGIPESLCNISLELSRPCVVSKSGLRWSSMGCRHTVSALWRGSR